jgi:hypothetical protein
MTTHLVCCSSPITKQDYIYHCVIFKITILFHTHNHTKKIKIVWITLKNPNTFFQVEAFGHRVSFRGLHKGLRPFTNMGMHKRGVQSPGDVQCSVTGWCSVGGACLPKQAFMKMINPTQENPVIYLFIYLFIFNLSPATWFSNTIFFTKKIK